MNANEELPSVSRRFRIHERTFHVIVTSRDEVPIRMEIVTGKGGSYDHAILRALAEQVSARLSTGVSIHQIADDFSHHRADGGGFVEIEGQNHPTGSILDSIARWLWAKWPEEKADAAAAA